MGHGVCVVVGVWLGMDVGVLDGFSVGAPVADGLTVAIFRSVADGIAVTDGRVALGELTGAASAVTVKARRDGRTSLGLSAASLSSTGTQADKGQSSKNITKDSSF